MQKLRAIFGGFSPIAVTALLSVLILGSVTVSRTIALLRPVAVEPIASAPLIASTTVVSAEEQQQLLLTGLATSTDASLSPGTDHLSLIAPTVAGQIIGTYESLISSGSYTKEDLRTAGAAIAENIKAVVSYDAFDAGDFNTEADVSIERVRTYRDDLQRALGPLSTIPMGEYEMYAKYVETNDPKYLVQLTTTADTYRSVANAGAALTIPRDSVTYHRDLLNALLSFAAVLDGLAGHADDPYATLALLRTYNEKEQGIFDSFNHMRSYYGKKGL